VKARTSFVLSGPPGTVVAEGIRTGYDDVAAAAAALADGSADVVVGALPFDVRGKAALLTPVSVTFGDAPPAWPTGVLPRVRIAGMLPAPEEHRTRIRTALRYLNDGESGMQKVVLARALRLVADGRLDERTILRRLIDDDAEATAYLADLSRPGVAIPAACWWAPARSCWSPAPVIR